MANFTTIVIVKTVDQNKNALSGKPVMILTPVTDTYNLKASQRASGTVVFSGNSDSNGYTNFTGVSAGTYDIQVVTTGNSTYAYGYVVKNEYVVNPDQAPAESRFAVRSGEHIQGVGAGILARNPSVLGGMYSSYTFSRNPVSGEGVLVGNQLLPDVVTSSSSSQMFQDPMDGHLFSVTQGTEAKSSGASRFFDNQNLVMVQRVNIDVRN